MDAALLNMLGKYNCKNEREYENALKEIIQHLTLLGLWRAKFFEHAAFYGGSALRIFHGSRRFSEDLDFSLLKVNTSFDLFPYMKMVETELKSFGFNVEVKKRNKPHSDIDSAFIKANTMESLLNLRVPDAVADRIQKNRTLKIKFEVDTTPPDGASYEVRTLLTPIPFQVELFNLPCLFAGKLHALLCRNWKNRVKGRDFYDFVWFIGNNVPCNIKHLRLRMIDSGHWHDKDKFGHEELTSRLKARFSSVDFKLAKADIEPFITDPAELELWSSRFFIGLLPQLKCL